MVYVGPKGDTLIKFENILFKYSGPVIFGYLYMSSIPVSKC